MQKKEHSKPSMDKNERKRGRPSGRNRVPLSLEERRARNAQYERERRNETAEAMVQLAEAACCDPEVTNPELLATVINRLHNRRKSDTLDDLKRINEDLESQIAALQSELECGPNYDEKHLEGQSFGRIASHSDSNSVTGSNEYSKPIKFRKTSKRSKMHDNVRLSSSSIRPEPSTDSQDSDCSNHFLGKTLPSQALQQLQPTSVQNELGSNSASSHLERSDSLSSECRKAKSIQNRLRFEDDINCGSSEQAEAYSGCRQATSMQSQLKFEDEFYSQTSERSEAFSEKSQQQDVTVEIQLLPELSQIRTESVEEQNKISFLDPYTDGEKEILERLGWNDFTNFQDSYSENQTSLRRPVDYPGY